MKYTLLTKQEMRPRSPLAVLSGATLAQVEDLLPAHKRGQLWALDLETKGTAAHADDNYIVGIAMADQDGCFYIDLQSITSEALNYVGEYLRSVRLTAFNVLFDGTFLQAQTGAWLDWDMCTYCMFKNLTSEGFPGQTWNLETAQRHVLGWDTSNKTVLDDELKNHGLQKADMYKLPVSILGHYAAVDADAAWQLYNVLSAQSTPEQLLYHRGTVMPMIRLFAAAQLRGLLADQERLGSYSVALAAQIDNAIPAFLAHEDVAPFIASYNERVLAAYLATEPPKTVKSGAIAARWLAWEARKETYLADNAFNPNSKAQLRELFFGHLGLKAVKKTDKGAAVLDKKVLPSLGTVGKMLSKYNVYIKRRGYLNKLMERSAETGLINPQFNACGTVSTRPSGGSGLNMLQMPKVAELLWALKARPGYKLVQADAEAIEPTILAMFSQDPVLLNVYGPNALPHQDIYLYVAAMIPALGSGIRGVYDPLAPTQDGLATAKKQFSKERDIAKTVHLACLYGAGAVKIHETILMGGIQISLPEVRSIYAAYWRLFKGVKGWQQTLTDIHGQTGGWVPSLLGRPLPVAPTLLKDIVNRHTQTSAHEFLQHWVRNTWVDLMANGLDAHPWLPDYYDETIWEVREDHAEEAVNCFARALTFTNQSLGMSIAIKGPAMIADDLAMIKIKDYANWIKEHT